MKAAKEAGRPASRPKRNNQVHSQGSATAVPGQPQPDRAVVLDFLRTRFDGVEAGYFTVDRSTRGGWVAEPFPVAELERAADRVVELAPGVDVYISMNVIAAPPARGSRVKAEDVVAVPGLYAELDTPQPYKGKDKVYPPLDVVLTVVRGLPYGCTFTIGSGGGVHIHALFREPFLVETEVDRERIARAIRGWQRFILRLLAEHGRFDLDVTADLARVLRPPGTSNHRSGEPVPVTVLEQTDNRVDLDEVEDLLDDLGLHHEEHEHVAAVVRLPRLERGGGLPADLAAKVEALAEADRHFRASWNHEQRPDLVDNSRSGHDLSMAGIIAQAGFDAEDIYRVLVAWRGSDDIPKRSYYGRTIKKALAGVEPAPPTAVEVLEAARALPEKPSSEALDQVLRRAAEARRGLDDIAAHALRRELVEVLTSSKVKGAAGAIDAALRQGNNVVKMPTRRPAGPEPAPYVVRGGCTYLQKFDRDGAELPVLLASFGAAITEEVEVDDGAERRLTFTIEGHLPSGEPLPATTVPAATFPGLAWTTTAWGNRAVISAGSSTRDHFRCAVQVLSGAVPRRVVYAHTGWRRISGEWIFLTAGKCIGADGVVDGIEVDLPAALATYALPEPPPEGERAELVRASLEIIDIGRVGVTVPLLAAAVRAVLAEVDAADGSVFLAGATGLMKTSVATVMLSHFGAFDLRHVPAGFHSTGNSLEKLAFVAKDVPLLVDDFNPTGTTNDQARFHRDAERIFRGSANRTGRQRMAADGSLRPTYVPRGLVLATGEDLPRGQSLRARLLVVEVEPGDIDLEALTEAQGRAAAGVYAQAMATYLMWLAPRLDELRGIARQRVEQLRGRASDGSSHRRTPEAVASLFWGLETYLDFAVDVGAITEEQAGQLGERCWEILLEVAAAQAAHIAAADPVGRFIDLLRAAFISGRAHVLDAADGQAPRMASRWGWVEAISGSGDEPHHSLRPGGRCIGWVEQSGTELPILYIDPEAAFAEVSDLARVQGEVLAVSQRTLWKRLWERGHIGSREQSQANYTIRKRGLGGDPSRRRVLHLLPYVAKSGPSSPTGSECNGDEHSAGTTHSREWSREWSRGGVSGPSGASSGGAGTTSGTTSSEPVTGVVPRGCNGHGHPGPLGPLGPLPAGGGAADPAGEGGVPW